MRIARCFAFVGSYLHLDVHFAFGNFIRDGLKNGSLDIQGEGTAQRSYLYANDLAIRLCTIFFIGRSCCSFIVGCDESLSIAEIGKRVAEQFTVQLIPEIHGTSNSTMMRERYFPYIQRTKSVLGVAMLINLPTRIRNTLKFSSNGGLCQ